MADSFQPLDIIGDVHGHADKLEALLRKLDYEPSSEGWRHRERTAVFLGDFIDRGPAQLRTLAIVRPMVESGNALAVMGNHELNAIAWHTPDPFSPGEFLRPHYSPRWGDANRHQHAAFLAEVEHDPDLHATIIEWFLKLPLWLDLPGMRVVHACWHSRYLAWLSPRLEPGNRLTRELLVESTVEPADPREKDTATPTVFKAVEALTKGIEAPLPKGHSFLDKDGKKRERVRLRWWDSAAVNFRAAAMLSPKECAGLPDLPIPDHARISIDEKPIFIGHYWLTGTPAVQSTKVACVDYSAGKGGPLVAYRYDGEWELSNLKFVTC
jgi:hypothetical protein